MNFTRTSIFGRFLFYISIGVFISLLFAQCHTTKTATPAPIEIRQIDTLYVTSEDDNVVEEEEVDAGPYQTTFPRTMDLIHTDLDISFDYAERAVLGKAVLDLTPLFYETNEVSLDAKTFEISSVQLQGKPLNFDYKEDKLHITLDRIYKKGDRVQLEIDYKAFPYRVQAGGSDAITSDRGLYFIDPDETHPQKPTQIWTQGETESSSRWFPTIDKPNERCTQRIRLTVKNEYETLSNGILTSSTPNSDGTKVDVWEMKQPHAPYLFMLAIGDFHREKDTWGTIPLEYIVEHDYAADAEKIFEHTPEMMTYFSNILNYPFPWSKYSQVIVRDYVSGAMENTTASLFGQFLQRPSGDLVDNGNDRIIAHELFHQWFGDLVTCESWSNLTLNEGFANYSEYLWIAHKFGIDAGEHHRYTEQQGYFGQAHQYAHPLVEFHYDDKEEMFDAHSYNKGGLVLHLLRNLVGDEAFFASLNLYLNNKKYQAAEVHDLRLAFEATTGLDLNWFFNQWFLELGHPIIEMAHTYDAESGNLTIEIEQVQHENDWPIFKIPTEIEIITKKGEKINKNIEVNEKENQYVFKVDEEPQLVLLDPKKIQLMEYVSQDKGSLVLYDVASSVWDRLRALEVLQDSEDEDREILAKKAIDDRFWKVRSSVIQSASDLEAIKTQLLERAINDGHANVRLAAIRALDQITPTNVTRIMSDRSNRVVAAGAMKLLENDTTQALTWANTNASSNSQSILQAVADIYVDQNVLNKTEFFEKGADRMSFDMLFPFYTTWAGHLVASDVAVVASQMEKWTKEIKSDDVDIYTKYAILTAFQPLVQHLPIDTYGEEDKTNIQALIMGIQVAASAVFGGG